MAELVENTRTCVAHKEFPIEFRTTDSECGSPNCGGTRTKYISVAGRHEANRWRQDRGWDENRKTCGLI